MLSCALSVFLRSFAMETEEQAFREELDTRRGETEVSYEEYRKALLKLLEPRSDWETDLRFILLPLGAIALGIVILFFIRQIRSKSDYRGIRRCVRHRIGACRNREGCPSPARRQQRQQATFAVHSDFFISPLFCTSKNGGCLPYDRSLTNREYLHQAQTDIALHTALGPAITVFDEVWYGHKPCDAETVANYRDLLQKVYVRN